MLKLSELHILSWNVWGGKCFAKLSEFFTSEDGVSLDVVCLQEVYNSPSADDELTRNGSKPNLMQVLQRDFLPNHEGYYFPSISIIPLLDDEASFPLSWGLAIFVRRKLPVIQSGSVLIHGHPDNFRPHTPDTVPRYLAHVVIDLGNGKLLTVANYHGLWVPHNEDDSTNKNDTPERLEQSRRVREVFDELPGVHKILCGDFNIRPDTGSFELMRRNLQCPLTAGNITSTRSKTHYKKEEGYADYMLTSARVNILDFQVLPEDEASDHLPLFLKVYLR